MMSFHGKSFRLHTCLCVLLTLLSACSTTRIQPIPDLSPVEVARIPDAVPETEPLSKNGNPDFYDALGKRYFVMSSAAGYEERGVASWYGPAFIKAILQAAKFTTCTA